PFYARRWRRRYDLLSSTTMWLVVPPPLSSYTSLIPSPNPSPYTGSARISPIPYSTPYTLPYTSSSPIDRCFKDLLTGKLSLPLVAAMMVFQGIVSHCPTVLVVRQGIVSHCPTVLVVRHFHPVSLCVASLSCCLNPLLYYLFPAEFRQHLSQRTSSPLLSSSIRERLMILESTSSPLLLHQGAAHDPGEHLLSSPPPSGSGS
ncbi:unnamed protein product, partial [Coregonus sp. 'balchen']